MTDSKTIIIYILSGALLLSIIAGGYAINKTLKYTNEVKQHYELELSKLKTDLQQSESQRQRLFKDADLLRATYSNLLREDSLRRLTLDSIHGKFDNLTPSELQDAMITEHKNFTK